MVMKQVAAVLPVRFRTPEEMREYLERMDKDEVLFSAIPIVGEPETFRYNSREQLVTRGSDGKSFDSMDDFICYAFQCDAEGYPRTEYVDVIFG